LFLSQGVPMLLGGDELGRTQGGNNNAWCQDNEISWFDWQLDARGERLLAFARRLIELRRSHPVFHRSHFFAGRQTNGSGLPDIWWFRTDGRRMAQHDWHEGSTLGVFLNGDEIPDRTRGGAEVVDDSFLVLLNGGAEPVTFRLPPSRFGRRWTLELSTADPDAEPRVWRHREPLDLEPRSLLVLRRV
jgi:glycogen operon protein